MIKVALKFYFDHVLVDVTHDDGSLSVTATASTASDPSPADVKELSDLLVKEVQALVDIHKGVV
jgi:hypothetical protein